MAMCWPHLVPRGGKEQTGVDWWTMDCLQEEGACLHVDLGPA